MLFYERIGKELGEQNMELSFKNLLSIIFGKIISIIVIMFIFAVVGYATIFLVDKPIYSNTANIYIQIGTVTSSTSSTLDYCVFRLNQNDFRNSLLNNQYSISIGQKNIENMSKKEYTEFMNKIVLAKSSDNTKIIVTFKSEDEKELKALTSEFIVKATATLNNELKINTVNILGGSDSTIVKEMKNPLIYAVIVSFVSGLIYIVVLIFIEIVKKPIRDNTMLKELGFNCIGIIRKTDVNSLTSIYDLNKDNLRNIRTNLDFDMMKKEIKNPCFLITSYSDSSIKTKIVYSLANTFAMLNKKTILIDGNLREATLSNLMKMNNKKGLSDLINSDIKIDDVINKINDNLDFIPAPGFNNKSTELLNDIKLKDIINELKTKYDYIIFDTASMDRCVDAQVLSQFVNATIVLTEHENSTLSQLDYVSNKFTSAGVTNIYVVIDNYKNTGLNRFFTNNYQY
jgi:capsular exopolysaccharide synthesis family protein